VQALQAVGAEGLGCIAALRRRASASHQSRANMCGASISEAATRPGPRWAPRGSPRRRGGARGRRWPRCCTLRTLLVVRPRPSPSLTVDTHLTAPKDACELLLSPPR
jgi:hypothetical protein